MCRRRFCILIALAAALTAALIIYIPRRHPPQPSPATDDPRLTFATPYLNVRPEVRYVGEAACASCHPRETKAYREHPMHRTLAPVDAQAAPERYELAANNPFKALGFVYQSERRGARVFHKETQKTPDNQVLTEVEAEVRFAVGSGTRGSSFLLDHDGYLFQSPLSWFSQKQTWALSPGYEGNHSHFERPIFGECLFCHSNRADPVPHTLNRYRPPIFQGYGIGCERCHGPGELHVRQQEHVAETADDARTIVNPKDLAPALREAVCEQCHLEGARRVLRRGRGLFDYRPGLPLHLFWSVFVNSQDSGENPVVGQVEQMHASLCFRTSAGKMGCTSCHDPHAVPSPSEKASHYRGRCLQCHQDKPCSLPETTRREKSPQDSCILCHMPRVASTNVAHSSVSDHRVPRQAGAFPTEAVPPPSLNVPLRNFHGYLVEANDADIGRDLGIALIESHSVDLRQPALNLHARRLLEAAIGTWPEDVPVWIALGRVHAAQHRYEDALDAYEHALVCAPENEVALVAAASVRTARGDQEAAVQTWQRAIAINPWRSSYHAARAKLLSKSLEWQQAADESQAALRLNPVDVETRRVLLLSLSRLGRREEARQELKRLLRLQPTVPEGAGRLGADQGDIRD